MPNKRKVNSNSLRRPSLSTRVPMSYRRRPTRGRSFNKMRLYIGLAIAAFSLVSYFGSSSFNPVTGETQYISLAPHQEIAMGLQAKPEIIQQHGGLYPDPAEQAYLDKIGRELVQNNMEIRDTEWEFDFHLLNDPKTVNAFALPGGQVFITLALYERLRTEGQLAGVIGHEIGHVVARHGAQQMAKSGLTQGLIGAVMATSGTQDAMRMAQMVGQMVNMKYGRNDELQSDFLGIKFMADSGYDPRSMEEVMKILAEAGGGSRQPEFFSTHPNPENRIDKIKAAINELYPGGVPAGMKP